MSRVPGPSRHRPRPILPRPTGGSSEPEPSSARRSGPPGRKAILAACESCRKRKGKCDGRRPRCSACLSGGRECVYETQPSETRAAALKRNYDGLRRRHNELRSSHDTLEKLVRAIQSQDSVHANTIFQKIREGVSPESIIRQISAGDVLLQLHVSPETRYRFQFPYKSEMPRHLLTPDNPYLQSLVYEATFIPDTASASNALTAGSSVADRYRPQYLKPYVAARIIDPRLRSVKPSRWTSVSTDDGLMKELLHLFFLHEYAWFPCFHKDHFLDDMLSGSTECCSPLLVNIVLAIACGCNRALADRSEYWNPQSLGYKFFAETKRLWELEKGEKSSLTTIQTGALMNIMYNLQSMDNLGMAYTSQTMTMGNDLNIFGPVNPTLSRRTQISYGFTAWCLYAWVRLTGSQQYYHYLMPTPVKEAPRTPLPDPEESPSWYGEFWLLYPSSQSTCPMKFGHLFKARGELAGIMNRISLALWDKDGNATHHSPDMIDEFTAQLDVWYSSLSVYLSPAEIVFPGQLKLHMLYHNIVFNLHELKTVNAGNLVPDPRWENSRRISTYAKSCLETLVRLYFLRHGYESADSYLAHPLAVMAFMALEQLKQAVATSPSPSPHDVDEIRSTLFLAAKGLSDHGKNYFVGDSLFQAVQLAMDPEDVEKLFTFVNLPREDHVSSWRRAKHAQAQYPVNIVDMSDHPEEWRLGTILREFEDISIEDQGSGSGSTSGWTSGQGDD